MRFETYRFTCRLESDAQLPPYKGSTFRGVFGRALKQVVCALKNQECAVCLLRHNCVYAQVFETAVSDQQKKSRMSTPPHPFVIEPPLTTKSVFSAGAHFEFNLMLFGEINNSLPYFIYAFEQMGRIGIGRKKDDGRGRFVLEKVCLNGEVIYSATDQKININVKPKKRDFSFSAPSVHMNTQLKLTLETPLRLKFDNKLQADLPFHILVRAMLRRISALLSTYGSGEPEIDYRGLVKQAEQVKTIENKLSWYDWQRYSFRQEAKMLMGGMIGSIVYESDMAPFIPLVAFSEQVHLGKQTTFGLGKFKMELCS